MSDLLERLALLDHYNDATPRERAVHAVITAIIDRLEPAEPRAVAVAAEGDGWLEECEAEWARAYPASWQNKWADRLIAAAKERDELRAQVDDLITERDEWRRGCVTANRTLETWERKCAEMEAQIETLTKERDEALVDAVPTRRLRQAIESLDGHALWLSQKDFIAALLASPRPSPCPKRVKGPRSKPNELRARIRREAHLAARTWNEVNGECSVAYRLDGMTAWGYAYCLREDAFDLFFGMELVYRRALEALEDGLRQRMAMGTGSYHSGELRSMEMDLPLWSWSDDDKAGKTP